MTDAHASSSSRPWRTAALILLTILLHLLAIEKGRNFFSAANVDPHARSSISVTLRPLEQPKQPVSLPVAAPVKPRVPRKRAAPKPVPAQPVVSENITVSSATSLPVETTATPAQETPEETATPSPASADNAAVNDSSATGDAGLPAAQEGTHYVTDPPPSAELEYDVRAFSDNLNWYGTSILSWKTDGARYSVDGEVYTRLFAKFSFLNFSSNGEINAFGVAPELYKEKKRNRPSTNTHFNRERNVVSFSASTTSYPRVGGEQDRASLIWQLAAIGRGDRSKFAPGAVIDLFVAGVRDGEVWRMQVVGLEEIRLIDGATQAWHIVRQPRPGSYDQRLDIWLEPGRQWYPARLRYTETNGDYLELSLTGVKSL